MAAKVKLTAEQRALLAPFEKVFGLMSDDIFNMSDADLAALSIAAGSVTTSNCSCLVFDAVAWLREQIYYEHLRREHVAGRALLASRRDD